MAQNKKIPNITGALRSHMILIPEIISTCSGIRIHGKHIRSVAFTTDVAVIKNINANAIIAVYPFTPQPVITKAIMETADVPVFCGVGGGLTNGLRTVNLALHAEFQGAAAVVLNAPVPNKLISSVADTIDIPIIITVASSDCDIGSRLDAGAKIINVSGAEKTAEIVANIRKDFPDVPIIATGGPNEKTMKATIDAGANCLTYTPPTPGELFGEIMKKYRTENNAGK